MQIVSAYLLAASAVDGGNYDEDYDLWTDPQFEEYMDIGGDDIVGEYVEINPPSDGGAGNFDGTKFCSDWLAGFNLPLQMAKIFANNKGFSTIFPSSENVSDWSGFKVWDEVPDYRQQLIPQALDTQCVNNSGKHINMWFVGFPNYPRYGEQNFAPFAWGMYAGSNVSFRCVSNQPTNGLASFSFQGITGDTGYGLEGYWYSHQWNANGTWATGYYAGKERLPQNFILVYNTKVFLEYFARQSITEQNRLLNQMYLMAECNVDKSKR